jgi:hypothetical protein
MRLGTYIVSGLIFLLAILGVVYMLVPTSYELMLFDTPIKLPVAIWVLIPAVLLFIVSILHIAFYGTKAFMRNRKWLKDSHELREAIYWSILKEPKKHIYSTEEMGAIAPVLNSSYVEIKDAIHISNEKLMKTIELVRKIYGGEYINLRERGLDVYLSKDNEISVKNNLNRLNIEPSFAKVVLQKREAYSQTLVDKSLEIAIESWEFDELSRYSSLINKRGFYKILDLIDSGKKGNFSVDNLRKFIDYSSFECRDFMRIAKSIVKKFSPDKNLSFVREMVKNSQKAESAYLYILFEYEMRDNIKRFFEEHDESEFKLFRAYELLKESGQIIKIDRLINYKTVCNGSDS